jgi:hypothetical protein
MSLLRVGLVSTAAVTMFAASSMDPLTVDPPHYTLEIENQWTRVFREHMGPRDTMIMHQHPMPGAVIVMLTDRHNRLTAPDGTFKEFQNKAGFVMWSDASKHQSENLDAINFEALQIEPRHPAGAPPIPRHSIQFRSSSSDEKHLRIEIDNDYVLVIREMIGPHEKFALPAMSTKSVVAYLTDVNLKIVDGAGKASTESHKAKQVVFFDASGAHSEENLSAAPVELIRVELKQAR